MFELLPGAPPRPSGLLRPQALRPALLTAPPPARAQWSGHSCVALSWLLCAPARKGHAAPCPGTLICGNLSPSRKEPEITRKWDARNPIPFRNCPFMYNSETIYRNSADYAIIFTNEVFYGFPGHVI